MCFHAVSTSLCLWLQVFNQHEGTRKCSLLFSTRVECWDASHRPRGGIKQILQSDAVPVVGEASVAASSFQEWSAITDIQKGTSRTRPRADGVQHVRLIMMEQDTPGIAVAPVGGRTHAASVVPLGSDFKERHDIKWPPGERSKMTIHNKARYSHS